MKKVLTIVLDGFGLRKNINGNAVKLANMPTFRRLWNEYPHCQLLASEEAVGLEKRLKNFPAQLSGGEQQRVAIARAVAKSPKILLADEPTGALDDETGKQILKVLEKLSREDKMTVIIITHNSAIAPIADKIIRFKNGKAESTTINEHPQKVEDINW